MKSPTENWYRRLLDGITNAQSQLIGTVQSDQLFDGLLAALLDLCDSEYGFIGETHRGEDGELFLRTHAITNIAWNDYTRRYYEENAPSGLEFHNLDTLFGVVMTTGKAVIANTPSEDPRKGGLPQGHPPLDSFLGLPLHSAGRLIGMAGVANRPGGYSEALIEDLSPFLQTCSNAIFAIQADSERKRVEGELNNERNRLRAILDGAYEAIITIDEFGIIESCNRQAGSMFDYRQSSLIGKKVNTLMPLPYQRDHDDYIRQYCETGNAKVIGSGREVMAQRRTGELFPIHLTVTELNLAGKRLFTGLIRDLSEREETDRRLKQLQEELARSKVGQLIGRSSPMRQLFQTISDVAQSNWTVLVEGETGTGKELVARAIHAASNRSDGPFIAVNCAGLSASILGSQLFGHRRGAFTGAVKDQEGFFQAAHTGTLFLDEIGDVSEEVQTSLLRALESAEVVAIGDTAARKVDIRVIAATNRNLSAEVDAGKFRSDLLYRLRVGRILVPALRDRSDDIPLLAEAFLAETRIATGKAIEAITNSAMDHLVSYAWPGNVRELRSAIQYAAIHCRSGSIDLLDLPPEIATAQPPRADRGSTNDENRPSLEQALELTGGNRSQAAKLLGISRATLYRRLAEAGPRKP